MSDNKNNTGGRDRTEINVNEDYEVQYWSEKFNVTRERLREAVQSAGTSVKKVEEYLTGNR